MRGRHEYFISAGNELLDTHVEFMYEKVFRRTFLQPGFSVLEFGDTLSSEILRNYMVDLKNRLSLKISHEHGGRLNYQWMGRFDQQETTKFHLDNAADQSFLMLGYEPSKVKSRLFFADYMQFARSRNISEEEYFDQYNPMFNEAEKYLLPFVTEIEGFDESTYKIVLMNNSNTTIDNGTIGVMHKAEIVNKDLSKSRVINSTMIYLAKSDEEDSFSNEKRLAFITTDEISKK